MVQQIKIKGKMHTFLQQRVIKTQESLPKQQQRVIKPQERTSQQQQNVMQTKISIQKAPIGYYTRKGLLMPSGIKLWQPNDEQIRKQNKIEASFSFTKPENWDELPLYEKSRVYGLQLGQKEAFYSDKLEIKDLVENKYKLKIAPIVRILRDINDLHPKDINRNHLLKATHGSGWNIDLGRESNISSIKTKLRCWNRPYNPIKEPHYRHIQPRFFIEEKIKDKINPNYLIAYRFRCIRGMVIGIRVTVEEKLYDFFPDWSPMKDNPNPDFPRPAELDEMLRISEEMSSEFEYVRIDLYIANDGIYFSEYTFTPNAHEQIYYDDLEMELGKLWKR